ncbi:MAG: Resolvase domain protein [Schlesneria sp.]|nr:Resolvase domain protein [Schlesneria sp.]
MYRVPYLKSFRYTCGQYQQSHCHQCDHNHVDGISATNFALKTIQQFLGSPELLEKLRQRFLSLAKQEQSKSQNPEDLYAKQAELAQLEKDLETVGRNLAMAKSEGQHQIVAKIFAELEGKIATLESEVRILQSKSNSSRDVDAKIEAAMSFATQLSRLITMPEGLKSAAEAIQMADFRLYLKFEKMRVGKRELNKVVGGVATIGAVSPARIENT